MLPVQNMLQTLKINQEALLGEYHVFRAQHLVEELLEVVAASGHSLVDAVPQLLVLQGDELGRHRLGENVELPVVKQETTFKSGQRLHILNLLRQHH